MSARGKLADEVEIAARQAIPTRLESTTAECSQDITSWPQKQNSSNDILKQNSQVKLCPLLRVNDLLQVDGIRLSCYHAEGLACAPAYIYQFKT